MTSFGLGKSPCRFAAAGANASFLSQRELHCLLPTEENKSLLLLCGSRKTPCCADSCLPTQPCIFCQIYWALHQPEGGTSCSRQEWWNSGSFPIKNDGKVKGESSETLLKGKINRVTVSTCQKNAWPLLLSKLIKQRSKLEPGGSAV